MRRGGKRAEAGEGRAALSWERTAWLGLWGWGPGCGAQGQLRGELGAGTGLVRAGKGRQGSGCRGRDTFRQAASDAEAVTSWVDHCYVACFEEAPRRKVPGEAG